MKQRRKSRSFVKYQLKDNGANPLTPRGRKWINKEIKKLKSDSSLLKLRRELENQSFDEPAERSPYWEWVQNNGGETYLSNPDLLSDEE